MSSIFGAVNVELNMRPLTDKQARILDFIRERIAQDGRPPTVREIGAAFRFASTHAVRCHLSALEKKGCIERSFNAARGIRLAAELRQRPGLPIVGQVAAGTPITAIENIEGSLSIAGLFPNDATLFCLRVEGDSMIGEGILDRDYVVVRQKPDFVNGEIGVAIVDGEATVKKLRRVGREIELIPANDMYEKARIDPAECEFRYGGEVVGVIRVIGRQSTRGGGCGRAGSH